MDSFDLGRLSDYDFEVVIRDLLSEILGVRFEIFARGKDRGIDLRHVSADGKLTIAQCKHWAGTGRSKLIERFLQVESPKVRDASPHRYIIVTSTPLTVGDKEKLFDEFGDYMESPGDVFGGGDVSAALQRRPALVQRHFRLWLSNTAVLQTVLRQDGHLRSAWLKERAEREAATFVAHEGFRTALTALAEQRVCILAGNPGVGKTTIALMLGTWLAGDAGFEVHEVSEDIREVGELWLEDTRQAFIYDDFLGQTMLERGLNKNEESRLAAVIRQIHASRDKALIMTTRDYILAQARTRSDKLNDPLVNAAISVVRLGDLTLQERERILLNHVAASRLSDDQRLALSDPGVCYAVARHANFNPRLIDETFRLGSEQDNDIAATLVANLDEPQRIWERIVENELPQEAVQVLEVLSTFRTASIDDLAASWARYRSGCGELADRRAFRAALRTLDGTMTEVRDGAIGFHNPSIADYLHYHLDQGRADIAALIDAFVHSDQLYGLVNPALDRASPGLLHQLTDQSARLATAARLPVEGREPSNAQDENADHLGWLVRVATLLDSELLASRVISALGDDLAEQASSSNLTELIVALRSSPLIPVEVTDTFAEAVVASIAAQFWEDRSRPDWSLISGYYDLLVDTGLELPPDVLAELRAAALGHLGDLADYIADGDEDVLEECSTEEIEHLLDFLVARVQFVAHDDDFRRVVGWLNERETARHSPGESQSALFTIDELVRQPPIVA